MLRRILSNKASALFLFIGLASLGGLGGCTSLELAAEMAKRVQQAEQEKIAAETAKKGTAKPVQAAPRFKIGDPYQIAGIWYYPERNLQYDETGIASWYGDQFAGRLTANGEIFDPEQVSAAHKTLHMPSVVRVTNLENGRSLVVRVNDRGPYVAGRIIDLSRAAARKLGFHKQGIARVRVQILAEQSLRMEKLAKQGQFPRTVSDEPLPEVTPAQKPAVKLTARTTRATSVRPSPGQSALDLLSENQVGEVIVGTPIKTQIWVQLGAFHNEVNARNVLGQATHLGSGQVTPVLVDGRTLYRARVGPAKTVAEADRLLDSVFQLGFSGAQIVVE